MVDKVVSLRVSNKSSSSDDSGVYTWSLNFEGGWKIMATCQFRSRVFVVLPDRNPSVWYLWGSAFYATHRHRLAETEALHRIPIDIKSNHMYLRIRKCQGY